MKIQAERGVGWSINADAPPKKIKILIMRLKNLFFSNLNFVYKKYVVIV